jgi:predicted DNA-binding transcriptional regulator AlpA
MLQPRFYYIEDMATILGKSALSIYGHLARKQYDAVPVPMKLGRRLAWVVEEVDKWIAGKVVQAAAQAEAHREFMNAPAKRRGRPTKAKERAKRQRER